jgi:hypothetical protein
MIEIMKPGANHTYYFEIYNYVQRQRCSRLDRFFKAKEFLNALGYLCIGSVLISHNSGVLRHGFQAVKNYYLLSQNPNPLKCTIRSI